MIRVRSVCVPVLVAACVLVASPSKAAEERVQADVSMREIAIESNFSGTRIVVFGTIENLDTIAAGQGRYGVAIVIRGPDEAVTAWRKKRVLGLWANSKSRTFESVPSYYAVMSSAPLADLAPPEVLQQWGIGFANIGMDETAKSQPASSSEKEFRNALVRLKRADGVYQAKPYGVTFIGQSLFRTTIDVPANVPVGEFAAEVSLFRNQKLVSRTIPRLSIEKRGFERMVYVTAFDYPFAYGLTAVLIAILAGSLAWAASRRD